MRKELFVKKKTKSIVGLEMGSMKQAGRTLLNPYGRCAFRGQTGYLQFSLLQEPWVDGKVTVNIIDMKYPRPSSIDLKFVGVREV